MNSAFVLFAYFAMLLSPCFVAQWGDLLSVRWIRALVRRRRTHAAESFLVSFRYERYAMAVALEESFLAASSEACFVPQPFLVHKRAAAETPAFVQGRQRVAARLAQLAVAQQLRSAAAEPEKVVALPPDVEPAPMVAEPVLAEFLVAGPTGMRVRSLKPEPVPMRASAPPVFRDLVEVAAALPGRLRSVLRPEPVQPRPPGQQPGESGAFEIAA